MNAFFKSPTWCILRSDLSVLATIKDVWSTEVDKECPDKALYYALSIIETSVTLVYILGICEARDC